MQAITKGEIDGLRDILAAVTPGGGKSLLPFIAAATLVAAGTSERVVWVVPRDSLHLQAEEVFANPGWRAALGHALSVRAADNEPNPSRGLAGYVTTYQGIAAVPELHLAEMRRHRTLLIVDEVHHLPGLADYEPGHSTGAADPDEASNWSRALLPLLECTSLRLLLLGTLERAPTAAPGCGCRTGPGRGRACGGSIWRHRAGPWWAARARKPWPNAPCCRSSSGPSTTKRPVARRTGGR